MIMYEIDQMWQFNAECFYDEDAENVITTFKIWDVIYLW